MKEMKDHVFNRILESAHDLYKDMGAEGDFNLFIRTPEGLRFGTQNHIYWTPTSGFLPDRTNCSREFLDRWDS